MKTLDRYILTTFLKTFLSVFVIVMFILAIQTIWLYISELAGKGIGASIIGKFLLYFSPKLIPLVLPLSILLASIMVFGSFAENYEFAAMKSTGISLQRAMRSLGIFIVGLAIVTFFFANTVIPWGEYKIYNLRRNLQGIEPEMIINEGQFNQLGNINIKIDKKKDNHFTNVIIHQKKNNKPHNYTVIKSESGKIIKDDRARGIQLVLYNGNFYEEIQGNDYKKNKHYQHAKSEFKKYTLNIDLEKLNNQDLDKEYSDSKYNMLNIKNLVYTIDSLKGKQSKQVSQFSKTLKNINQISTLNANIEPSKDTIYEGDVLNLFDTKKKLKIVTSAFNSVKRNIKLITTKEHKLSRDNKWLNLHIISLHEKFALSFACVILFFIGAPLGAIIKKGGLGLPIVIAMLLFLTYHFIGVFAKNSAQNNTIHPILASWFASLIMFPISVYLTSKATRDKALFSFRPLVNFKKILGVNKKQDDVEEKSLISKEESS